MMETHCCAKIMMTYNIFFFALYQTCGTVWKSYDTVLYALICYCILLHENVAIFLNTTIGNTR